MSCSVTCGQTGQTGLIYPETTQDGRCVCETQYGYYLIGQGAAPCDADGDGWIRDTARSALESDDSTVRGNARCALRKAQRVVLQNESGESYPLYFTQGKTEVTVEPSLGQGALPLYESVSNDDPALLISDSRVPPFGQTSGARSLQAKELNSFTKACVSAVADHNDNGLPDVQEWARLPDTQIPVLVRGGGRDAFLEIYTRFSYFVELHVAWFEPTGLAADGKTSLGVYYIRERSRDIGASDKFGLRYGVEPATGQFTSDFWQFCPRSRDLGYGDGYEATTYDFASVSGSRQSAVQASLGNSWSGMMHHSQFKCVQIASDSEYAALKTTEAKNSALYRQTEASLAQLGWQLNRCTVAGPPDSSRALPPNPASPIVSCTPDSAKPEVGDVLWAAVRIAEVTSYERGCVAQCAGNQFLCPGSDPALQPTKCNSLCGDFSGSGPLRLGVKSSGQYWLTGEISSQAWGTQMLGKPNTGYSIRVLGTP